MAALRPSSCRSIDAIRLLLLTPPSSKSTGYNGIPRVICDSGRGPVIWVALVPTGDRDWRANRGSPMLLLVRGRREHPSVST